jgi:hypothetical protein
VVAVVGRPLALVILMLDELLPDMTGPYYRLVLGDNYRKLAGRIYMQDAGKRGDTDIVSCAGWLAGVELPRNAEGYRDGELWSGLWYFVPDLVVRDTAHAFRGQGLHSVLTGDGMFPNCYATQVWPPDGRPGPIGNRAKDEFDMSERDIALARMMRRIQDFRPPRTPQ